MKNQFSLFVFIGLLAGSCNNDEKVIADKQIQFTFSDVSTINGMSGGRTTDSGDPKSVLVTIEDATGNTLADKKELTLYKFGDNFLSSPLTLQAGNGEYRLTEFFITDSNNVITLATPKEGSALAHLVADPLDIEFSIESNEIKTVTPEVIAVDADSNPGDFGYGQFGFQPVNTIRAVFSSFIKGATNFELTTSHIKIESLSDTTVVWTYETELAAKANTLVLRESSFYRVTATKEGYATWKKTLQLNTGSKTEILFEEANSLGDIHVIGYETPGFATSYAMYWKNGLLTRPTMAKSKTNGLFISGNDVYISGQEEGTKNAFYWKNGEKVIIPFNNSSEDFAGQILVAGNDVYVSGSSFPNYTIPYYWKNGVKIILPVSGNFTRAEVSSVAVDGSDVYFAGSEGMLGTTNNLPSYPRIWKNSVMSELPLPSADYKRTFVSSIIVKNGHLYICGQTQDPVTSAKKVILWKDNSHTILESSFTNAYPSKMFVEDNGTIHIVGVGSNGATNSSQPVYWKNGVETTVDAEVNAATKFYGVDASGPNVLIAGTHDNKAVYWNNGKRTTLFEGKSVATSVVFVKK